MKPEEKVYKAYFKSKKSSLYFNELKEISGLSDSSLANTLRRLVNDKILLKEVTKSNTFYNVNNKKLFALTYSVIAVRLFTALTPNVKVPLQRFLKGIPDEVFTIVLFGSASRGEECGDSDIDILVVSNAKLRLSKHKKEAEVTSKYPLSLFQCTIQEFKQNEDDIIIQARKTGFPIHKEQNFYEAVLREY